jgi:tetratricopeptide (TPR) repeat protein
VAIRTGDREAAARLQELFEEVTDRAINNGASGYGAVDAYRALLAWELGRNEDAHALWKSGLALNEETGLPLANLYPLMLRGHQLASHGNTAEAAEIYRRARSLAETRDLSGTIELIDTALAPGSTARA